MLYRKTVAPELLALLDQIVDIGNDFIGLYLYLKSMTKSDFSINKSEITKLSTHLFWDTPIENVDPFEHRGFIVERVMRYGRIEDWKLILRWYGKDGLRDIVVQLRDLDNVGISFLSLILDLKNEDFRCYRERQSQPSFWES